MFLPLFLTKFPTPTDSCLFNAPTRLAKNSSRFLPLIAKNRSRSNAGMFSSAAAARTLQLNANHDISGLNILSFRVKDSMSSSLNRSTSVSVPSGINGGHVSNKTSRAAFIMLLYPAVSWLYCSNSSGDKPSCSIFVSFLTNLVTTPAPFSFPRRFPPS